MQLCVNVTLPSELTRQIVRVQEDPEPAPQERATERVDEQGLPGDTAGEDDALVNGWYIGRDRVAACERADRPIDVEGALDTTRR